MMVFIKHVNGAARYMVDHWVKKDRKYTLSGSIATRVFLRMAAAIPASPCPSDSPDNNYLVIGVDRK